jgi:O-methyltransferase involved in polyketide biosynthesis
MKHLSPGDASQSAHDFDSISPSAYALLMMKGLTPIPYAREAAALMQTIQSSATEAFGDYSDLLDPAKRHPGFWARVLHFESRYFSVDQLLSDLTATNILELSSGFSFRGLALSRQRPVFYIDTDLPNLIATKRRFVEALTAVASAEPAAPSNSPDSIEPAGQPAAHPEPPGHYELQPLNVLDTPAFDAIAGRFPPGELTIVNEGLLVYLDTSEKERLCRNIRDILVQRGGCWITGDIYLRNSNPNIFGEKSDAFLKFIERHNIEENKFSDFDEARAFFARMGFTVEREAAVDFSTLSALPNLLAACNSEQLDRLRQSGRTRIHTIWRLRPA